MRRHRDTFALDPVEAKITAAALGLDPSIVETTNAAAASLTKDWLKKYGRAIADLSEAQRVGYARLQAQSREPEQRLSITVSGIIEDSVSVQNGEGLTEDEIRSRIAEDRANQWPRHLYQDEQTDLYYKAPTEKDGLERKVLETELASKSVVAWYRNPAGGDRAVCIPYRDSGSGRWARLYPDFIFFHELDGKILPSIVDPHGLNLADWPDKLRGAADYAEFHSKEFRSIYPLTVVDGHAVVLALHDASVRASVLAALDAREPVEAIFREFGLMY